MLTNTEAAKALHLSPAEFSKLRRTFPLVAAQGKDGPRFGEDDLLRWWTSLPFTVRQSLANRKPLAAQARNNERDRDYLMRLWGYLRSLTPPLGAPVCSFFMRKNRFELVDHRGRTLWSSLREAIQGMREALYLARTRAATILKAA